MKVAFLITAYNQPRYLLRLIKALSHPDFYFFIHIDLNADISQFKSLDFGDNTVFLDGEYRIRIFHGGYTQSQSVVNLMKVAASSGNFDYFFVLSGSDYPIKSANHIFNFLKEHYPTNFIDFYPLLGNANSASYVRKYYFVEEFAKFSLSKPVKKYAEIIQRKAFSLLPDRSFPNGMIPFRGAPWFCLNKETVRYIIDFLDTKEGHSFVSFFQRTWGSAEIVFQTIVLNSPHAKDCRYYDPEIYGPNAVHLTEAWRKPNKAYLHYMDWSKDREDPAVLNMHDFESLKASDFLFARKFFDKISGELLDRIDKEILSLS